MKCTSYLVDRDALISGVPVEQLERLQEKEIKEDTLINLGNFKASTHLFKSEEKFVRADSPDKFKTLKVSPSMYDRILKGELVKTRGGKVGNVYKIVNENESQFYVFRQLYCLGESKYFAQVTAANVRAT